MIKIKALRNERLLNELNHYNEMSEKLLFLLYYYNW